MAVSKVKGIGMEFAIISEQTPGLLSLLKRQNILRQCSSVHQGVLFLGIITGRKELVKELGYLFKICASEKLE